MPIAGYKYFLSTKGVLSMEMSTAIEGLESYDVELTRKSLKFLIQSGSDTAIKYIMPLTIHPDVAIRYIAKKAVKLIRSKPSRAQVETMQSIQNIETTKTSQPAKPLTSTLPMETTKPVATKQATKSTTIPGIPHLKSNTVPQYRRSFITI